MRRRDAAAALTVLLVSSCAIVAGADDAAVPAVSPPAAARAPDCDTALGKRVFAQCAICHSIEKDAPPSAGPNLYGILDSPAASKTGFGYSQALRASGKRWTREELDHFLAQPMSAIPGTSMAFGGLKKPEERAAVICHLGATGGD